MLIFLSGQKISYGHSVSRLSARAKWMVISCDHSRINRADLQDFPGWDVVPVDSLQLNQGPTARGRMAIYRYGATGGRDVKCGLGWRFSPNNSFVHLMSHLIDLTKTLVVPQLSQPKSGRTSARMA
jgi:hypothetical protein